MEAVYHLLIKYYYVIIGEMAEFITPSSVFSDERLGSGADDGVHTVDEIVFPDGTVVDWNRLHLPARGTVSAVSVESYNVYDLDGSRVVDAIAASQRVCAMWADALTHEATTRGKWGMVPIKSPLEN